VHGASTQPSPRQKGLIPIESVPRTHVTRVRHGFGVTRLLRGANNEPHAYLAENRGLSEERTAPAFAEAA
jgi:hypothetical protein